MSSKSGRFTIIRGTLAGLLLALIAFLITRDLLVRPSGPDDSLRRIRERGYLLALTDRNTLNYHINKGYPTGVQLELLESFASWLGVPLRIIARNDVPALQSYLLSREADVIALPLPVSNDGGSRVVFTAPMGETRLVLVRKKAGPGQKSGQSLNSPGEFPSDSVYVTANPFFEPFYHEFRRKTGRKAILVRTTLSQEELLARVESDSIRYALCGENVAEAFSGHYGDLDYSLVAFPLFSYGWALPRGSDSLRLLVNRWTDGIKKSGELKQILAAGYYIQRVSSCMRSDYFSISSEKLSPFDKEIRTYSPITGWDWRLIASLIYEESNFQQGLMSARSAYGLMQLMPATAARFGIDSASTAGRQIGGGIKYLRHLDELLPGEIVSPHERKHFVLAAYNVGLGRVLAARKKAEASGHDPNRWNGHVDYYLLRRPGKNTASRTDSILPLTTDHKIEGFVDDIFTRYYHYRNLIR